jgi:hypothetical protein
MNPSSLYFLGGLVLITAIDTLGAIASRKFNFNYAYLSVLSFAVHIALGYFVSLQYGLSGAIVASAVAGLYDATIGFKLSIHLNANNGLSKEEALKTLNVKTVITVACISMVFGIVGYALSLF